jgi:polyhydroxyalkanoate synthesis regulator phasin
MKPTSRLLAGGAAALGAGLLAVGPLRAAAQDDDGGGWVEDTLSELVEDGTLTQDQADAVADALNEARPERPSGPHGPWLRGAFAFGPSMLSEAAEAIGIDEDELLDALRDGETIAELAEENGVEPRAVIDALVAAVKERLDEAVADGDIDQETADERLADAEERVTEFVNEGFERLERLPFPRPDRGWLGDRNWGPWHHDEDRSEETSPNESSPDTTSPDTTSPETTTPETTSPETTSPGGS